MAKKTADTVRLSFEVELKAEYLPILAEQMEGPATMTEAQKIRDMAEQALVHMATGGVMFTPEEVKMVEDSTGVVLSTAEELIPFIVDGAAMEEGFHVVRVKIDPEYFRAYEEIAQGRESTVDAIVQEITDQVIRDGWVEEIRPYPRHVIMNEADAAELEAVLGGKFQTGTDLIKLLRVKLVPEVEDEPSNLFADDLELADVASNVGLEGQ